VAGGLVVHLGCGSGELTASLRANERYVVHGLDTDAGKVAQARRHIQSLGLYGSVSVQRLDGRRLPYADNLVNLLIAEDVGAVRMDEVMRVLCPRGVACVRRGGEWARMVKPWPKAIDEWTHWLHAADGNAVARDEAAGPPRGLQWVGPPVWSRHHNTVPSVSAMVSARGRVFAIVDEAPPGMHGDAPDKWALVARDAFNGLPLWRIPLADWGWRAWSTDWHCRFTVPTQIPRRLVAAGDRLYVTLGFNAPLSELDAATGKVLRVVPGTEFTDEILFLDGTLILAVSQGPQKPAPPARRGQPPARPVPKRVMAVDAATGRTLWRRGDYVGLRSKTGSMDALSHLALAAGGGRVFFADRKALVCLDLKTGHEVWRAPRPEVPEHKMRYDIRITDMCSLVCHGEVLYFAQLNPDRRIDWREIRGRLHAFSAETGKELWQRPCASWGWGHPADVVIVDGLVWVHDYDDRPRTRRQGTPHTARDLGDRAARAPRAFVLGLDPATGQVRRKVPNLDAFDNGHHHRCYRNKATTRWLMTSFRGLEFIGWGDGATHLNHWVRGTCRLGAFPCNGLVYATPHPCDCYISAKLNGWLALAPVSGNEGAGPPGPRLVRGPAYAPTPPAAPAAEPDAWPTYRHDPRRSGATATPVSKDLEVLWEASVGAAPSACTVAEGRVFAASVATHEVRALGAQDGKALWSFTAGGPVDTPPTVCGGQVIFGCADGHVYCLRASDGTLAWRFRAAPRERLVGAYGRLESAWPVHGSVLAEGGKVWFVAGRSSFLDGGIFAYCLDAATGEALTETTLRTPASMPVGTGRSQTAYYGALPDILVREGGRVWMRGLPVFGQLGPDTRPSARGLRSTAGLLGSAWFNRTHWLADGKPLGGLLVCTERTVYGVEAFATRDANRGFHKPGAAGYRVFAQARRPALPLKRGGKRAAPKATGEPAPAWSVRLPVRVTAMALAGPTLFIAGTRDELRPDAPWAAYEGRRGGLLVALSAAEGTKLAERPLAAAPVYDGLAATGGRLYVPTVGGKILCLGSR